MADLEVKCSNVRPAEMPGAYDVEALWTENSSFETCVDYHVTIKSVSIGRPDEMVTGIVTYMGILHFDSLLDCWISSRTEGDRSEIHRLIRAALASLASQVYPNG